MFGKIIDRTDSALIRAKIAFKRFVTDPVKDALSGEAGISELVQGLLIAGIVVVLVVAAFGLLKPSLTKSAQDVANQLENAPAQFQGP